MGNIHAHGNLCRILGYRKDKHAKWLKIKSDLDYKGILHLLANDSYRTGQFLVAAKAFDVLDRYDPNPNNSAAKKGASVGLFQMVLAGREHR